MGASPLSLNASAVLSRDKLETAAVAAGLQMARLVPDEGGDKADASGSEDD